MTSKRLALVATLAALSAGSAHAELFGLLNGRSADPSTMSPLAVEAGIMTGGDFQNIGARVNYSVSPQLTVFGDFGLAEVDAGIGSDADGNAFGGGLFFFLGDQQFLPQFDVAGKISYHIASLEFGGTDVDYNNLSLGALLSSPEPFTEGGLKWYANAGFNRIDADIDVAGFGSESDTEILLGGGVVLPLGPGEVYGGVDLVDSIQFGAGFRYFVQ